MGHNLHVNSQGEASFFHSELRPAWHGLGKNIGRALTAEEALRESGQDFEVVKIPLVTENGLIVPNKFATVRTDEQKVLGVVGNKYHVVQNAEAFSFFDNIVNRDEAIYHSAGVLGDGQKAWIMAKLPSHINVKSEDKIELYVVIIGTHDGSGSIWAFLSPQRIVCENTLNAAINRGEMFVKIRHTRSASEKLAEAHRLMGISNSLADELNVVFNAMADKKVSAVEQKAFIEDFLMPMPALPAGKDDYGRTPSVIKYREEIWDAVRNGAGQDMPSTKNTAFGLYNGVTFWLDHTKNYTSDKLDNIWLGNAAKIRQNSFDYLSSISM